MVEVNIKIESVSGEKSEEIDNFSSSEIQISTNLNILELQSDENSLTIPYVFEIKYQPPIGRISLKGKAETIGNENELQEIREKHQNDKTPPEKLVRKIIKQNLAEAAVLSKTLNIPAPMPLPPSLNKERKN